MKLFHNKEEKAKEVSDEIFKMLDDLAGAFPLRKQEIESTAGIIIITMNVEKNDSSEIIKQSVISSKKMINDLLDSLSADAEKDQLKHEGILSLLEHFDYALERGMPFYDPQKNGEMRAEIKDANEKLLKKVRLEKAREKWKEVSKRLDKLV